MADAIATGVTAALIDAAGQGLAVGMHLQQQMSWSDVVSTGFTAGMASYFDVGGSHSILGKASQLGASPEQLAKAMLVYGSANVMSQLSDMALGISNSFDIRQLVTTMLSSVSTMQADAAIGLKNIPGLPPQLMSTAHYLEMNTVNSFIGGAINSVVTQTPLELKQMAAQAIGTTAVYAAGAPLGESLEARAQSLSRHTQDYQSSVDASNGSTPSRSGSTVSDGDSASSTSTGRTSNSGAISSNSSSSRSSSANSAYAASKRTSAAMSGAYSSPNDYNLPLPQIGIDVNDSGVASQLGSGLAQMNEQQQAGGSSASSSVSSSASKASAWNSSSSSTSASSNSSSFWSGVRNFVDKTLAVEHAAFDLVADTVSNPIVKMGAQMGSDLTSSLSNLINGNTRAGLMGVGFFALSTVADGVSRVLEESIDLYRAVRPDELEQIQNTATFANPYGIERKYFSTTFEGAQQYAKMAEEGFGDEPYTIIKTNISKTNFNALASDLKETVDRGIKSVLIPSQQLKLLSDPKIINEELTTSVTNRSLTNVTP